MWQGTLKQNVDRKKKKKRKKERKKKLFFGCPSKAATHTPLFPSSFGSSRKNTQSLAVIPDKKSLRAIISNTQSEQTDRQTKIKKTQRETEREREKRESENIKK